MDTLEENIATTHAMKVGRQERRVMTREDLGDREKGSTKDNNAVRF